MTLQVSDFRHVHVCSSSVIFVHILASLSFKKNCYIFEAAAAIKSVFHICLRTLRMEQLSHELLEAPGLQIYDSLSWVLNFHQVYRWISVCPDFYCFCSLGTDSGTQPQPVSACLKTAPDLLSLWPPAPVIGGLELWLRMTSFPSLHNLCRLLTTNSTAIALVTSHVDYCNSILVGLPHKRLHKLQQVQNSAAGIMMKLGFGGRMCWISKCGHTADWICT